MDLLLLLSSVFLVATQALPIPDTGSVNSCHDAAKAFCKAHGDPLRTQAWGTWKNMYFEAVCNDDKDKCYQPITAADGTVCFCQRTEGCGSCKYMGGSAGPPGPNPPSPKPPAPGPPGPQPNPPSPKPPAPAPSPHGPPKLGEVCSLGGEVCDGINTKTMCDPLPQGKCVAIGGRSPPSPKPAPGPSPPPSSGKNRIVAYVQGWASNPAGGRNTTCPTPEIGKRYTHVMLAFLKTYGAWQSGVTDQCASTNGCQVDMAAFDDVCYDGTKGVPFSSFKALVPNAKVLFSLGGAMMGGTWVGGEATCWQKCFANNGAKAFADQVVKIAVDKGLDGIDLDYEDFYRPGFEDFITELSKGLKAAGKILTSAPLAEHMNMDDKGILFKHYQNVVKDDKDTFEFIAPQYYNDDTYLLKGPALQKTIKHREDIVKNIFGGDESKVIVGACAAPFLCPNKANTAITGDEAVAAQKAIDATTNGAGTGLMFWDTQADLQTQGKFTEALAAYNQNAKPSPAPGPKPPTPGPNPPAPGPKPPAPGPKPAPTPPGTDLQPGNPGFWGPISHQAHGIGVYSWATAKSNGAGTNWACGNKPDGFDNFIAGDRTVSIDGYNAMRGFGHSFGEKAQMCGACWLIVPVEGTCTGLKDQKWAGLVKGVSTQYGKGHLQEIDWDLYTGGKAAFTSCGSDSDAKWNFKYKQITGHPEIGCP